MVAALLDAGELDPTVINGGIINAYGTNARLGDGDWMVVEADESDGTFLRLPATIAVVTNIDPEHLDHYGDVRGDERRLRSASSSNIPFYGFAVLCIDHPEVQAMIPRLSDRRIVTYGFSPQADVRAERIVADRRRDASTSTSPTGRNRQRAASGPFRLPMFGQHNVQNALAAIAVGARAGHRRRRDPQRASRASAASSAASPRPAKSDGITVIDDYGHHPVEIAAVLRPRARRAAGRVIAVVQPHRYTRLAMLFDGVLHLLQRRRHRLVADVYAAGEAPIAGVNRDALVDGLARARPSQRRAAARAGASGRDGLAIARPGDFVVCLGAGNITQWAAALPQDLSELQSANSRRVAGAGS